ncbi:YodC family protein [Rodentibacter pneumotropicus]|uniref:YodC family protein n=1 Tax=Rodentibacter pneumotropicus TaxID=758 RepID=UPI0005EE5A5D|nr:DUF2158 domain-containing protein [Rodentibacter pneumotropicus]NBH74742.1 DUF2158 domain-containing protein [Rodentibacter pneumotropicus]THA02706.1 DUF2158 domain-containing protein [Rodentibacter pneumotropicus]THA09588.1 DUF2158 domain-containing protein [Rodentibacter pneumotropicus]THA16681.1 DUF2158 domain-containing protein [Rodentibacter pneumotropicus]
MEEIKVGDTVQLKSGGPVMTVISERTDDEVLCKWFDSNNRPYDETFPKAALYIYEGIPSFVTTY